MRFIVRFWIAALVGWSVSASAQSLDKVPRDATVQSLEKENAELKKEIGALRDQIRLRKQRSALKAEVESETASAPSQIQSSSGQTVTLTRQAAKSFAADLPVKAPPRIAPLTSWTGFYAGINVGYGWGNADPHDTGTGTDTIGIGPFDIPNFFAFRGTHNQKLNGFLGGDQVGYNYQTSERWILGIEADIQAADQRTNNTFVDPVAGAVCSSGGAGGCGTAQPFTGAAVAGYQAKIEWFGTVRGRAGWLVTDQTLLYATGGLAYGHVGVSGNVTVSGTVPVGGLTTFNGVTSGFSTSRTNVGWTVGGGLEGKFAGLLSQNWSWKLEYLYLDLGSLNASTAFSSIPISGILITPMTGTASYHTHLTDNVARVGINYKFH